MARPTPPKDPGALTRFIQGEFHARHRARLPALAALSEEVESIHAGRAGVPAGLAGLLRQMIGALEVHMKMAELILFPAMRKAAPGLDLPIAALRANHEDHTAEVEQILGLTSGLTLPAGACASWTRLYAETRAFLDDLKEHIRLENEVLFPQFETGVARHG
ncbi:hemerythrin domain-containing protein [Albidovulum sediminicola]|uniref:Hemerythrin domain-containing protein n=1 Tax=Albidovulum sediminicola TaxID=2984331 RepID=A0ABT2Z480_9RHOB|nr:hemerythrin domain-containing protein [Defluviimonas sp. WL0075]MCV2865901.1 hemerythrin domain-containing protein [Defluviimonas sp. WL0075]